MDSEPIDILGRVVRLLDQLGIPYMVGGSLASSAYGVGRMTRDVDLVVDLSPNQVEPMVRALEAEFYVSREAMREAIRDRRSFNAIHLDTAFKVDFFVLGSSAFDHEEFRRRTQRGVGSETYFFKTAEDAVLSKLAWYRAGDESSDQQWRDVVGMLVASGDRLERSYLDRWAEALGVSDLLERARKEAEQP